MDYSTTTLYDLIVRGNMADEKLIDEIKDLEKQLTDKKNALVQAKNIKKNKLAFARYFLYGVGLKKLMSKLQDFDFLKIEDDHEFEVRFTFTFNESKGKNNNSVYLRFSFFNYGNKIILSHDGNNFYSISDVKIDEEDIITYKSQFIPTKYPTLLEYEELIIYHLNTDLLEEQYDRTFYTDDMIVTLEEFFQGTLTEHNHFFNELDEAATAARREAERAKYEEERIAAAEKKYEAVRLRHQEKTMAKKKCLDYDEVMPKEKNMPKKKGIDYLHLEKELIDANIMFESEEELANGEDLGKYIININDSEILKYSALLRENDNIKREIIILGTEDMSIISENDKKILDIIIKNNNDEDMIITINDDPSLHEKYGLNKFLIGAYEDDFTDENDESYITQRGRYQLNSCGVPLDWVISKKSFRDERKSILWSVPFQNKKYAFVYNAYETNQFKLADVKYKGRQFPQLNYFIADKSGDYYILQTDDIPVGWNFHNDPKDPQEGMWYQQEADDLGGYLDLIIF